ncbi:hypothetical protein GF358_03925 [Candidatus Woesearchaeota archaeon]|nr:hypothetical protein [Candidatus Woesearchaeota archaeon]
MNQINNYLAGILRVGHNTREFTLHNIPSYSPHDKIILTTLDEGIYTGKLGLFLTNADFSRHPDETIKDFVEIAINRENSIGPVRPILTASETIWSGEEAIEHNLYHVFYQRTHAHPRKGIQDIMELSLDSLLKESYQIHPGHQAILDTIMVRRKNITEIPRILKIDIQTNGKKPKVNVS